MLAVAVASSRTLEVLDLEGTGLTNQSAQVDLSLHYPAGERVPFRLIRQHRVTDVLMFSVQVFLDMVENYPTSLRVLVLAENSISPELQQQICDLLSEGEEEDRDAPPLRPDPTSNRAVLPVRFKYQPIRSMQTPTWLLPHSSKG